MRKPSRRKYDEGPGEEDLPEGIRQGTLGVSGAEEFDFSECVLCGDVAASVLFCKRCSYLIFDDLQFVASGSVIAGLYYIGSIRVVFSSHYVFRF